MSNPEIRVFYDILKKRKSIRNFIEKPIEQEKKDRLIDVLRHAPSAANRQPWHFILVEETHRPGFNAFLHREGFHKAPLILVGCLDPDQAWTRSFDEKNYGWVDVTIAVTEFIGAATAEGLGTCWIAKFDPIAVAEYLGIPEGIIPVILVAVGYTTEPLKKEEKPRKELKEIIHFDKW